MINITSAGKIPFDITTDEKYIAPTNLASPAWG
jgi:hypothetical protein